MRVIQREYSTWTSFPQLFAIACHDKKLSYAAAEFYLSSTTIAKGNLQGLYREDFHDAEENGLGEMKKDTEVQNV